MEELTLEKFLTKDCFKDLRIFIALEELSNFIEGIKEEEKYQIGNEVFDSIMREKPNLIELVRDSQTTAHNGNFTPELVRDSQATAHNGNIIYEYIKKYEARVDFEKMLQFVALKIQENYKLLLFWLKNKKRSIEFCYHNGDIIIGKDKKLIRSTTTTIESVDVKQLEETLNNACKIIAPYIINLDTTPEMTLVASGQFGRTFKAKLDKQFFKDIVDGKVMIQENTKAKNSEDILQTPIFEIKRKLDEGEINKNDLCTTLKSRKEEGYICDLLSFGIISEDEIKKIIKDRSIVSAIKGEAKQLNKTTYTNILYLYASGIIRRRCSSKI